MNHLAILTAALACFIGVNAAAAGKEVGPTPAREWTVMVYMNAKNDLEPDALRNFRDMATHTPSNNVAVVVQLGRPINHRQKPTPLWSGVYRFLMTKGLVADPKRALVNVATAQESTDMGKPQALEQFMEWAVRKFPAKRYMLVIWNHGQGWRLMLANTEVKEVSGIRIARAGQFAAQTNGTTLGVRTPRAASVSAEVESGPVLGGYRAVSFDDDTGHVLFNSEVQDVLASFSNKHQRLDLLGFDACLMGMMETAYGMSGGARVMVASEELVPGAGWPYAGGWLAALHAKPTMNERDLAAEIVRQYGATYRDSDNTTMTALDLSAIPGAAKSLSQFSERLEAALDTEGVTVAAARGKLLPFGVWYRSDLVTSIDLLSFLENFQSTTQSPDLRALAADSASAIKGTIFETYASKLSTDAGQGGTYGAKGLAIYFPSTLREYESDPYKDGYDVDNRDRPVAFVRNEQWSRFLHRYLATTK